MSRGEWAHLFQLAGLVVLLLGKDQIHFAHVIVQDETHFGLVELLVICLKVLRVWRRT